MSNKGTVSLASTRSILTSGGRLVAAITWAFALGTGAAASAQLPPPSNPWPDADLNGKYVSGCSPVADMGEHYVKSPTANASSRSAGAFAAFGDKYFRRMYIWKDGAVAAHFIFFADSKCEKPLAMGQWDESYTLGEAIKTAPLTRKVNTNVQRRTLTILAPELLPLTRGCGAGPWFVGIPRDLTKDSCLGFGTMFGPMGGGWASKTIVAVTPEGVRLGRHQPDDKMVDPEGRERILNDENLTLFRSTP